MPGTAGVEGECGAGERIGEATIAAGAGEDPYLRSKRPGARSYSDRAHRTQGAPFGLSIVVPAVAGPFDLGNVSCARRSKSTRTPPQLTITSDPLPIIRGRPAGHPHGQRERRSRRFMFNPTNCAPQAVAGAISSAGGASATLAVSSPLRGRSLRQASPFKPKFNRLPRHGGKTSKAGGASLVVKVGSKGGPSGWRRSEHREGQGRSPQAAALASDDAAESVPGGCVRRQPGVVPGGIDRGRRDRRHADARAPAHRARLPGLPRRAGAPGPRDRPAGRRHHDRPGRPDEHQGGITSSTFRSLPDAPTRTFDLMLPDGPHSLLGANLPRRQSGACAHRR